MHVSGVVSGSVSVLNRPHPADVFRWIRSRERSPGGGHGRRDSTSARAHTEKIHLLKTHTHTHKTKTQRIWMNWDTTDTRATNVVFAQIINKRQSKLALHLSPNRRQHSLSQPWQTEANRGRQTKKQFDGGARTLPFLMQHEFNFFHFYWFITLTAVICEQYLISCIHCSSCCSLFWCPSCVFCLISLEGAAGLLLYCF